jgi:hypothetical protein
MAVEAVVGLVGADRGDRRGDGGEQAVELAAVGSLARGQGVGAERAGPGIDRQVQLAPDPQLVLTYASRLQPSSPPL